MFPMIPPGLLQLLLSSASQPPLPPVPPIGTTPPPTDNTIGFGPTPPPGTNVYTNAFGPPSVPLGVQNNPGYGQPTSGLLEGQYGGLMNAPVYTAKNSPGMTPTQRLEASPGLGSYKFAASPELTEDNVLINQLVGGGIPEEQATVFGTKAATENRRQREEIGSIEARQQKDIEARQGELQAGEKSRIAEQGKALRQSLLGMGVSADAIPEFEAYVQTGKFSEAGRKHYEAFTAEQKTMQRAKIMVDLSERIATAAMKPNPITGELPDAATVKGLVQEILPAFVKSIFNEEGEPSPENPDAPPSFEQSPALRPGLTTPTTIKDVETETAKGQAKKAIVDAGQILSDLKRKYPDPKMYVQKTYEQIVRSPAYKELPELSKKEIIAWLNRTLDRDLYNIALAKGGPVQADKEYPGFNFRKKK